MPALALTRTKATLEILPDQRFVVFHGNEHEAASVKLTGRVRLHLPEPMSILKPRIRLEGKRKVGWWQPVSPHTGTTVEDKKTFWNEEQKLGNGIESAHKHKAGTIEWPFEFQLAATMPESVEGLYGTYVVYRLYASVARPGFHTKDVTASEHIRIVRTLGQESMEMTRSRFNTDIWANKISYTVSIPSDAVVFGTSITANLELSPLKKGIKFGKIQLALLESVTKRTSWYETQDPRDRIDTEETEVAKRELNFPEDSLVEYPDETPDSPELADEMYRLRASLSLPKSLNVCRQHVDSYQINISHRFKISVTIRNPEGHDSQLICKLPVKIFISPNLPVDESNEVHLEGISEEQLNSTETMATAPPEYGRHQLDQLYNDIDPSGFMSRAGTGPNTPAGLMAQSRRNSHENIRSLSHIADEPAASLQHGSATLQQLHSRLEDLQVSDAGHAVRTTAAASANHSPLRGASPAHAASGSRTPESHAHVTAVGGRHTVGVSYFPASSGGAPTLTRHASDDIVPSSSSPSSSLAAAAAAIHQADYNLASLSRVPSYGAALQTPTGSVTPFVEGPPSYEVATSRPPSPVVRPTAARPSSTTNLPVQQQQHTQASVH